MLRVSKLSVYVVSFAASEGQEFRFGSFHCGKNDYWGLLTGDDYYASFSNNHEFKSIVSIMYR